MSSRLGNFLKVWGGGDKQNLKRRYFNPSFYKVLPPQQHNNNNTNYVSVMLSNVLYRVFPLTKNLQKNCLMKGWLSVIFVCRGNFEGATRASVFKLIKKFFNKPMFFLTTAPSLPVRTCNFEKANVISLHPT